MERLTERSLDYCTQHCPSEKMISCAFYKDDQAERCLIANIYNRLAAYEDTGLEPEQVKDAIRIAERIATADYPHNFQRERSDIADYMRWITDVMRDAKAWWNGRIKTRAEAEKAMEVTDDA